MLLKGNKTDKWLLEELYEEKDMKEINDNGRQAYLIIAHKDDTTFRTLIHMLDNPKNDIFIHMDKKYREYSEQELCDNVRYSSVYHTERTRVTWGYSQINAELLLLRLAVDNGKYQHYHLLSGEDLPIQKQEYIQSFLKKMQIKNLSVFNPQI